MRALYLLVLLVGGCTCDGDPGRPRVRFNVGANAPKNNQGPDAAQVP